MKGFTLVELVLVIALISILSVITSGAFFRTDQFAGLSAREGLIASSLLAQKRAIASGASLTPVSLVISQDSSDWSYRVEQGGVEIHQQSVKRSGTLLNINNSPLADSQSVTLNFDQLGEIGSNQEFTFGADNSHSLCISSTGFAYLGACQP